MSVKVYRIKAPGMTWVRAITDKKVYGTQFMICALKTTSKTEAMMWLADVREHTGWNVELHVSEEALATPGLPWRNPYARDNDRPESVA